MSKPATVIFQRSLIAAAVLSLTACSSLPHLEDFEAAPAVRTVADATRSTVRAGAWAVDKTVYMLGVSDRDPGTLRNRSSGQSPANGELDEVDLALLEQDPILPEGAVIAEPVDTESALIIAGTNNEQVQLGGDALASNQPATQPLRVNAEGIVVDANGQPVQPLDWNTADGADTELLTPEGANIADATPIEIASAAPAPAMYEHQVQTNETLWDIAKRTTGDANNWHIIADINNLAPDASVFPGQTLTIPDDMVKPELIAPTATASLDQQTDDQALEIPAEIVADNATTPTIAGNSPVATVDDAAMDAVVVAGRSFDLGSQETLWDFAKRTTGDATNWRAIAAQNGWTEDEATRVYPGQSIDVPETLVKAELLNGTPQALAAVAPESDVIEVASDTLPQGADSEVADAAAAVLAGSNDISGNAEIEIVEASYNSEQDIVLPLEEEPVVAAAAAAATVTVSGTYYPKAIYNEADFSSSLLMRVSPGEQLEVSDVQNGWYRVQTDKGVGYMHERDIQ